MGIYYQKQWNQSPQITNKICARSVEDTPTGVSQLFLSSARWNAGRRWLAKKKKANKAESNRRYRAGSSRKCLQTMASTGARFWATEAHRSCCLAVVDRFVRQKAHTVNKNVDLWWAAPSLILYMISNVMLLFLSWPLGALVQWMFLAVGQTLLNHRIGRSANWFFCFAPI